MAARDTGFLDAARETKSDAGAFATNVVHAFLRFTLVVRSAWLSVGLCTGHDIRRVVTTKAVSSQIRTCVIGASISG
jgi:hypothetical protein